MFKYPKKIRVGFVSTRISGTDGVSLEVKKWTQVLKTLNCECFYFAGELDTPASHSFHCREAHFSYPSVWHLHQGLYNKTIRSSAETEAVRASSVRLKRQLQLFIKKFHIDLIITENCLSIPLHIPLGLALTEIIAETGLKTIAHHHDFFWERTRFQHNCIWDYLHMAFPPCFPSIRHVVINSTADKELSLRTGVSSTIIPNVMDFENPPPQPDAYTRSLRADLGLARDEYFFLQPTRVVQRKGIEHAIELVSRLKEKARLVISHASGDEGDAYEERVRDYSRILKVDTVFVSDIIGERRGRTEDGRKIYTLADVYPYADFITYPSIIEGFGNAFLESLYYRKPIVVNNYSIYSTDIKPKGFRVVEFDNFITKDTVAQVEALLRDPKKVRSMAAHNRTLAIKHYSFSVLKGKLYNLIVDQFGM
ncbi:MAG: glycosyltransferase family 4 protein [Fibrobacterota bacterium]